MTAPPGVPACRGTDNPGLFESTDVHLHEKARTFCDKCPVGVKVWCLEERERVKRQAIAGAGPEGTWGGLLWNKEGRAVLIEHGTDKGYQQHRHRRDKACKPCQDAHRAHNRAKEARRKAAELQAVS